MRRSLIRGSAQKRKSVQKSIFQNFKLAKIQQIVHAGGIFILIFFRKFQMELKQTSKLLFFEHVFKISKVVFEKQSYLRFVRVVL